MTVGQDRTQPKGEVFMNPNKAGNKPQLYYSDNMNDWLTFDKVVELCPFSRSEAYKRLQYGWPVDRVIDGK